MKSDLRDRVANFHAGQISNHKQQWEEITKDEEILRLVDGVSIDFSEIPSQERPAPEIRFSDEETHAIDVEIQELLEKGVIVHCQHSEGEFVSAIFVRPKKDNKLRMILNLKNLNKSVEYHHFKMETFRNALALVTQNCWFASLDLKDAYYSVHIEEMSQEYLKFFWKGQLYKYTAFPNGLACCPRLFTKLLKPAFSHLHRFGFLSTCFIDDSLLLGQTKEECADNVVQTLEVLQRLGFVIHPEKSVFEPTHSITYLGFVIDSETMTVQMTEERKQKLFDTACKILYQNQTSVRELARLIGLIVASFPAVKFGPLFYRHLEDDKIKALKHNSHDYDGEAMVSPESKEEINWWISNVWPSVNDIEAPGDPDFVIFTDASLTGWGCHCDSGRTGGHWKPEEAEHSINVLELKAVLFGLQTFVKEKKNIHIRVMSDNMTAVSCVNKMGTSHSQACNTVTKTIWLFAKERGLWLSAAFIPGKQNVEADEESRKLNLDLEWKIDPELLKEALFLLKFQPEIDLFASRLNKQLEKYVSYRPDPEAAAVDAFSINWHGLQFYAFPPFSVIPAMLRKIVKDKASGVIVVPDWPSQTWYPVVARMLVERPVLLSAREHLLTMPQDPAQRHRLRKTLRLIICRVSGTDCDSKDYQTRAQQLFAHHGDVTPQSRTQSTLGNGENMRAANVWIPFRRL